jgi:hypothetical protein
MIGNFESFTLALNIPHKGEGCAIGIANSIPFGMARLLILSSVLFVGILCFPERSEAVLNNDADQLVWVNSDSTYPASNQIFKMEVNDTTDYRDTFSVVLNLGDLYIGDLVDFGNATGGVQPHSMQGIGVVNDGQYRGNIYFSYRLDNYVSDFYDDPEYGPTPYSRYVSTDLVIGEYRYDGSTERSWKTVNSNLFDYNFYDFGLPDGGVTPGTTPLTGLVSDVDIILDPVNPNNAYVAWLDQQDGAIRSSQIHNPLDPPNPTYDLLTGLNTATTTVQAGFTVDPAGGLASDPLSGRIYFAIRDTDLDAVDGEFSHGVKIMYTNYVFETQSTDNTLYWIVGDFGDLVPDDVSGGEGIQMPGLGYVSYIDLWRTTGPDHAISANPNDKYLAWWEMHEGETSAHYVRDSPTIHDQSVKQGIYIPEAHIDEPGNTHYFVYAAGDPHGPDHAWMAKSQLEPFEFDGSFTSIGGNATGVAYLQYSTGELVFVGPGYLSVTVNQSRGGPVDTHSGAYTNRYVLNGFGSVAYENSFARDILAPSQELAYFGDIDLFTEGFQGALYFNVGNQPMDVEFFASQANLNGGAGAGIPEIPAAVLPFVYLLGGNALWMLRGRFLIKK